jgi:LmbE family N-acetylglucosaminyl deacetylase
MTLWQRVVGAIRARGAMPAAAEAVPIGWTELVFSSRAAVANPTKLMIVAHPDDESLFGGEALTSSRGWTIVCVTNATHEARRREFASAMTSIGANYTILGHFDHLESGNFNVRLDEQLRELIEEFPYEMIVTHNERGEYGHPQHRAVHRIVRRVAGTRPIYVFAHPRLVRPRVSTAKWRLLDHYASQCVSIAHAWPIASRERLRRIQ